MEREEARRRGGHASAHRVRRRSAAPLESVFRRLEQALGEVEMGQLPPEQAVAMAQVARTMCFILRVDEERLHEVEGRLAGRLDRALE
ncbi:MAG: hypothetical protein ACRDVM_01815 [Acidimicrobiia bacterium]